MLHTDPPDGYASVSIVDISYLGGRRIPPATGGCSTPPLLPFDGMNERGLAVGLAADESGSVTPDPGRPTVGSVRILRLVLDQAATVAEALAVIGRYNLDFDGGPPLHYLLADATGASAVVEFVDGRMRVLPGTPPWQVLTNIRLTDVGEAQRQRDPRYATASAALTAASGTLDWRRAMQILRDVAQPHTRWSVTYELRTGAVRVVAGKRWAHGARVPAAHALDHAGGHPAAPEGRQLHEGSASCTLAVRAGSGYRGAAAGTVRRRGHRALTTVGVLRRGRWCQGDLAHGEPAATLAAST